MLIDFSFKNFLSFRDEATLSMLAVDSIKGHETDENLCSLTSIGNERLLKTAAIYGANASGKSNIVSAFGFFKEMIRNSSRDDNIISNFSEKIFLFDPVAEKDPASFEMTFMVDGQRYRYGFEIKGNFIAAEWLFTARSLKGRESYCFKRQDNNIIVNTRTYSGTRGIDTKTRDNALFLSTCAQFNVDIAIKLMAWFKDKFKIISDNELSPFPLLTADKFHRIPELRRKIAEFMKLIDLGIEDIRVEEKELDPDQPIMRTGKRSSNFMVQNGPNDKKIFKTIDIYARHKRFQDGKEVEPIDTLLENESLGTRKVFAMLGKLLTTIAEGGVLVIDEFSAGLHENLAEKLFLLFHDCRNTEGQLIFASHNTNFLRRELLRRDQIWFVEKDKFGCSHLYSLVEFKKSKYATEKNGSVYGRNYLDGTYGAIPFFGNISQFLEDYLGESK